MSAFCVVKYGLIKLIGEKTEYRVSYKTLLDIVKAKEANFNGQVDIPEINMRVQISQIIMMKSELETIRIENDITNLPTASVCLDLDFKISPHIRGWFLRNQVPYYQATVHYKENNGIREYYLEFNKIKRLLKIDFDEDGYDYISEIYKYGIEKNTV